MRGWGWRLAGGGEGGESSSMVVEGEEGEDRVERGGQDVDRGRVGVVLKLK